jgi:hypothetical protein
MIPHALKLLADWSEVCGDYRSQVAAWQELIDAAEKKPMPVDDKKPQRPRRRRRRKPRRTPPPKK